MSKATEIMKKEIEKLNFINGNKTLISNVTANEISSKDELKKLLVDQIEKSKMERKCHKYDKQRS